VAAAVVVERYQPLVALQAVLAAAVLVRVRAVRAIHQALAQAKEILVAMVFLPKAVVVAAALVLWAQIALVPPLGLAVQGQHRQLLAQALLTLEAAVVELGRELRVLLAQVEEARVP
jgi:hypothetical protein